VGRSHGCIWSLSDGVGFTGDGVGITGVAVEVTGVGVGSTGVWLALVLKLFCLRLIC